MRNDFRKYLICNQLTFLNVCCCVCTDRLDGRPSAAAKGRRITSFWQTSPVGGTITTAADHRRHAILTDGLRADSRGRFGHVVNSPPANPQHETKATTQLQLPVY